MGEVEEEQKYICKLCNKSCSSGRSLGGHMRWHLPSLIAASKKKKKMKGEINTDCEDHDHYNCGLKENPDFISEIEDQELKKPRKMAGLKSKPCNKEGFFCKECGKKFPSSQGVAGHMRTHSKRGECQAGNICTKRDKGFDSMKSLIGHMEIHSEKIKALTNTDGLSEFGICYPKKKRSLTRYMITESNYVFSAKESDFNGVIDEVKVDINSENDDHYNCGLKENPDFVNEFEDQEPKKPQKMSGLNANPCNKEGFFCKECSKKFSSSQGVAGHMRTHSKKGKCQASENICTKCDKGFDSMKALIGHMKIHSEKIKALTNTDGLSEFKICYPIEKGSVTRYMINESISVSSAKESAFNVEIDEDDMDAAVALIMLSMGVRESAIDANSLEHFDKAITKIDGEDLLGHVDEMEKHVQKPKSCLLGWHNSVPDHSLCPNGQAMGGHKRAHSSTLQIEDAMKDIEVENEGFGYIPPNNADSNGTHDYGVSLKWTTGYAHQCVPMAVSY